MLSGGQQQRVVIARAMLLHPRMIVADEPVSMLDMSVRVEVLRLLQGLQRTHNLAVVYITHDLSTVRYFSERIFVMYAGEIVEQSRMDDILRNPSIPIPVPSSPPSRPRPRKRPRLSRRTPRRAAQPCQPALRLPVSTRAAPISWKISANWRPPLDFETEPQHYARCFLYKDSPAVS